MTRRSKWLAAIVGIGATALVGIAQVPISIRSATAQTCQGPKQVIGGVPWINLSPQQAAQVSNAITDAITSGALPASNTGCLESLSVTLNSGAVVSVPLTPAVVAALDAELGLPAPGGPTTATQATTTTAPTQPASGPTSQPASQPASQPTSLPTTQPGAFYAPQTPSNILPKGYTIHIAGSVPKGPGMFSANHTALQTFRSIYINGFDQNAVSQNYAGGATLSDIISVCALHDPANLFDGQGWYFESINGVTTISDSCFAWNGWQTGQPVSGRGIYYHGLYLNASNGTYKISGSLFASNAASGVETRVLGGGVISGCVFADSGVGVLNVMGIATIQNCDFIGCHFEWSGSAWQSGTAIQAYWPVKLINCRFVGLPIQNPNTSIPNAETFPSGMIVSGGTWSNNNEPVWTPPPAGVPLVTASGCTIYGQWPGPMFGGQTPAAKPGVVPAGFVVKPAIVYDPTTVVNGVMQGKITKAAGIAQIQAGVTAAASGL